MVVTLGLLVLVQHTSLVDGTGLSYGCPSSGLTGCQSHCNLPVGTVRVHPVWLQVEEGRWSPPSVVESMKKGAASVVASAKSGAAAAAGAAKGAAGGAAKAT